MSMPLFIQSCHASLEYDHARMFRDLGFSVFGEFDVGSSQRPKIPGVTDHNSNINDFNFIVLHQVPKYCRKMKELLDQGKRVVLVSFGQTDTWQYVESGKLCREYPHAYIAAYSAKDFRLHRDQNCPSHKIRLIRFGKYLDDFQPWTGEKPTCYATCNSIHRRGHGCGWVLMDEARKQIPLILSGKDTQEVGGLGEVTELEMRELLRTSACFLSFGTAPAAIVMTQIEAWSAGCPTVCYDSGHGLKEENLPLIMEKTVDGLVNQVRHLIAEKEYRNLWHRQSLDNARRFDVKTIGQQWTDFIKEIMA